MLTRRRPGVYFRGTWFWLYVRAVVALLISLSFCSGCLLHLIEHLRQGVFDSQRLLDFVGGDIRILPVLDEARTLVVADELDERFRICFPIRWKPFEVFEDCVDSGFCEERNRVLSIFIEIRVEDSLIHEPRVVVEEHPAEVVELEGREHVRITLQRFRQIVSVVADRLSCSRLDRKSTRLNSSHSQISYAV